MPKICWICKIRKAVVKTTIGLICKECDKLWTRIS